MTTSTDLRPSPISEHDRRVIDEHVACWEAASMLSHEQAEAIRAYERAGTDAPVRRIPLVAELIGYVGVALVLAAAFVLLGEYFGDLSQGAQLAIATVAALVFFAAGWPLHRTAEPALQRLAAVLWTVSIGAFAGALAIAFYGGSDPPESVGPVVAIWAMTAAYAAVLLRIRASSLLQLGLLGALIATIVSAGTWGVDEGWRWLEDVFPTAVTVVGLVLATAWITLGRAGIISPQATAVALGAVIAAGSPLALLGESVGVGLLVGVAVTAVLLATSVWLRSVPALILGAIGLFGYVTGCAVHFLADSAGLPLALLLSGLLLVGIALLTVRLGRITKDTAA
jgi:hypothetical protein